MNRLEEMLKSEPVRQALKPIAELLKWGEIVLIIRDSKVVMSEIKQAVKHS
jgi:hypothetical protein